MTMSPTEMSKVRTVLAYLHWVTLPAAIYWRYWMAPGGTAADAFTFCLGVLAFQPVLTLIIRILVLRTPFELGHARLAMGLHLTFTGVCLAVVVLAVLLCISMIGMLVAILLFYAVLPAIALTWWAVMTSISFMVALGRSADEVRSFLPPSLKQFG